MFAFQIGAAFKPSTLGSDKAEELLKLVSILSKHGYTYLVVDSERESDDPSSRDVSSILSVCKGDGPCTPVFTVPVRRRDFGERFEAFLKILATEGFGGLCLVAGNPAYLSGEELSVRAGPLILDAASKFREVAGDLPLFVGSENMVKTSRIAAQLYSATPVALLSPKLAEEQALLSTGNGGIGVYAPFYVGEECRMVRERLAAYIRRRNTSLSLDEAIHAYGLYGDKTYLLRRLVYLARISVEQVIGYPLVQSEKQLALFASVSGLLQGARP